MIKTGAPWLMILSANLDFSYVLRPAWYVFAIGLLLVAARLLRGAQYRKITAPEITAEPRRPGALIAALATPYICAFFLRKFPSAATILPSFGRARPCRPDRTGQIAGPDRYCLSLRVGKARPRKLCRESCKLVQFFNLDEQ
ncbi:MAG: hypothetical protein ACLPID_06630 [Beijerinckiaceae bacterium]